MLFPLPGLDAQKFLDTQAVRVVRKGGLEADFYRRVFMLAADGVLKKPECMAVKTCERRPYIEYSNVRGSFSKLNWIMDGKAKRTKVLFGPGSLPISNLIISNELKPAAASSKSL